jgi:hypothetical protein
MWLSQLDRIEPAVGERSGTRCVMWLLSQD